MSNYKAADSLLYTDFTQITEQRVHSPEKIFEASKARIRRKSLTTDGKLNIVAADHPARATVSIGSNKTAMADRYELLARLIRILSSETTDGVLASNDILEELLILDSIRKSRGESSILDNKVVIGSLNRGGLPGSVWELDDRLTGPTPQACLDLGFDAVKMLLRVDKNNPDTIKTIEYSVQMINEATRLKLPMFLEPLAVVFENGKYKNSSVAEVYAELLGVATALGNSSSYVWLKLPYVENYAEVIKATTLPIVLLGGDRTNSTAGMLQELSTALASGHQVRGVMYGRNLLFPGENDPLDVANAIGKLVHGDGDIQSIVVRLKN